MESMIDPGTEKIIGFMTLVCNGGKKCSNCQMIKKCCRWYDTYVAGHETLSRRQVAALMDEFNEICNGGNNGHRPA